MQEAATGAAEQDTRLNIGWHTDTYSTNMEQALC